MPLLRLGQGPLTRRVLGVPWLFAVAYAAVGFSLYFSIGVVADRGLGLTPLVFLAAGLLFVLATLSYVEGGAMFLERGGSSTLARHAFNELISFIAGWAILIDYIIVIALAAVSVPHYLSPIWGGFTHGWAEIAVAAAVIAFTAGVNIAGFTGHVRQRPLIVLALADIALQLAVIAVGAIVAMHPDLLTAHVDLFTTPVRQAPRRGAGGGNARVRRHRGGLRPGSRPGVGAAGPAPRRQLDRRAPAADLRGDGGDRADGGAGRSRPRRAAHGARRALHRGAGPRAS